MLDRKAHPSLWYPEFPLLVNHILPAWWLTFSLQFFLRFTLISLVSHIIGLPLAQTPGKQRLCYQSGHSGAYRLPITEGKSQTSLYIKMNFLPHTFYSKFKCFYYEKMLDFIKCISASIEVIMFGFPWINVIYYIDSFCILNTCIGIKPHFSHNV